MRSLVLNMKSALSSLHEAAVSRCIELYVYAHCSWLRLYLPYQLWTSRKFITLIPPEVIESEILTRLPVKSLLRFKSVCKSWNLLITNPYFISKHHHVCNLNDIVMIWSRHSNNSYNNLHPKLTGIIGCINGLVCFYNYYENNLEAMEIFIWNPATKQCLKIPPLPDKFHANIYSYDLLGFGYDLVSDDFKFMYATCFDPIEQQPLVGKIYSCKSGCWRKIVPSNFLSLQQKRAFEIYNKGLVEKIWLFATIIKGSPYWFVELDQSVIIISFDVRHESFRLLPDLGSINNIPEKAFVMMNLRDSLAVMLHEGNVKRSFFSGQVDVYVFNEKCSIWSKTSIGPFMIKEPTAPWWQYCLVECCRNGDLLFMSNDLELTKVNLESHTVENLKSLGKEGYLCKSPNYSGCAYSESLIFIEGMASSNDKDDYGIFFLTPLAPNFLRKESGRERNREIDKAIEAAQKDMEETEDEAVED